MPPVRKPRPYQVTFMKEDAADKVYALTALDELGALQAARALLKAELDAGDAVAAWSWRIVEARKPRPVRGRPAAR